MSYKKILFSTMAIAFILSAFLIAAVQAAVWLPNLPIPPVTATLTSTLHDTLFQQTPPGDTWYLDNYLVVPPGYDVTTGTYTPSWCVDRDGMTLPNNAPVYLFSSYSLPSQSAYPRLYPPYITSWNKINYILNNIPAGATTADIQQAIWAFCAPPASPDPTPTLLSQQMVSDANNYGATFEPGPGQKLAIICYPVGAPDNDLQITIITITIRCGLTPGYWKNRALMPNPPYMWTDNPNAKLDTIFTNDGTGVNLASFTLLQALSFPGGKGVTGAEQILLRAAVAALQNAGAFGTGYPMTRNGIISAVNNALQGNNREAILALASTLDGYNNLGAP